MQALVFLLAALILFGGDLFAVAVSTSSAEPTIKPQISRHLRELPSVSCQVSNTFRDSSGNANTTGGDDVTPCGDGTLVTGAIHERSDRHQIYSTSLLKNSSQKKWLMNRTILR